MTITYPLALPGSSTDIAQFTLIARQISAMTESPFSSEQQVLRHLGGRWEATVDLNTMTRAESDAWVAFFDSLHGRYGTFLMGDPTSTTPKGAATGSPKVATGSENGWTLNVYSATASLNNWLKAGDLIQLGTAATSRMYRVMTNADTTSGGVAALDVWPRLRTMPASGEALTVNSAQAVWRLVDGSIARVSVPPGLSQLSFSAVEQL